MLFLSRLLTLLSPLLLAPPGLADADSDAVNERIPVRKAELEQHWRVDCNNSWQSLLSTLQQAGTGQACTIPADLGRQLKLCAFIYQAPGSDHSHRCPDYRGASALLQRSTEAQRCTELADFLRERANCTPPG